MSCARVAFLSVALAFAGPSSAGAAPPVSDTPSADAAGAAAARSRALEMFKESKTHYQTGDFARAAELLEQAHAMYPEPVLLYNLARAYEGMGELEPAVTAYGRFLEATPNAADRGSIEQRIATLKKQIREREDLARAQAQRTAPEVPDAETRTPSVWPWIIAGLGVLDITTGVVLGAVAAARHDDAVAEPDATTAEAQQGDAQNLALGANVAFGTGAALVLAGGLWGIIDVATLPADDDSSATLLVGPGSLVYRQSW